MKEHRTFGNNEFNINWNLPLETKGMDVFFFFFRNLSSFPLTYRNNFKNKISLFLSLNLRNASFETLQTIFLYCTHSSKKTESLVPNYHARIGNWVEGTLQIARVSNMINTEKFIFFFRLVNSKIDK